MFIDSHTHFRDEAETPGFLNIHSFDVKELVKLGEKFTNLKGYLNEKGILFSVGLHPWSLSSESYEKDINSLAEFADYPGCVGIGEFGFDRAVEAKLDLQKRCFKDHLKLLFNHPQKYAVLHIVRAYDLLEKEFKDTRFNQNILIHGYNGSEQLTCSLLTRMNLFFGIGPLLSKPQTKLQKSLPLIPPERILLETDDSDQKIENIYNVYLARQNKILSLNDLKQQMARNLQSLSRGVIKAELSLRT